MQNLIIEKTKKTLGVNFNSLTGECTIEGVSLPENASEFFIPIIGWVSSYMLEVNSRLIFNFRIDYLNSSSIKFLSDLFDKLEMYHLAGGDVTATWFHDEDDDDLQMMGEEFGEDITFRFKIKSNNGDQIT